LTFTPTPSESMLSRRSSQLHRRFIYKGDTSSHAEGTDSRGGLERASEGEEALWVNPVSVYLVGLFDFYADALGIDASSPELPISQLHYA